MWANAALFQFADFEESPDRADVYVDGVILIGHANGSTNFPTITKYDENQLGADGSGEKITFDYQFGNSSIAGIVYVALLGAADDSRTFSDEFLLYSGTDGIFHVEFVSFDTDTLVIDLEHPSLNLPAPTRLTEEAFYQTVAFITIGATIHDTFQVQSVAAVPEPATLALLGVGLAGLGFSRPKH